MKRIFLAVSLLAFSTITTAKSPCDPLVPYGYPTTNFKSQTLCRTSYLQLHNNDAKTGGISFQYLTPSTVGTGNEPRTNNFRADVEVPRESRATPKEYEGTGYDRGHIAPAGDMQEDGKSMSQSFFMSNMAPQHPNLNRGIWRGLETLVRNWTVKQNRNLFVITGTAYLERPTCLPVSKPCSAGDGLVWIPDAFYKVIIDKDNQDAVAFIIPHEQGNFKKLVDYRITIADLQKIIGVDLIPSANPAIKQKLLTATGSTFPNRL